MPEREVRSTETEYMPDWAKGVSDDDLFAELRRRRDYYMRGWRESYCSAEHWQQYAHKLEEQIKEGSE